MKIIKTSEVATDRGVKILVFGPPGSGKTFLSSTTGDLEHTLILSAEAGLLSLRDYDIDAIEITDTKDLKDAFLFLVGPKNEDGERVPEHNYKWVILDSISEIAEKILDDEKKTSKDPRQAYGELADRTFRMAKQFRELPMNVCMIAKIQRIDNDGAMLFMPDLPGRQLGPGLPYLFDGVFAMRTARGEDGVVKRWLQTENDGYYDCKDRSGGLDGSEHSNLARIERKMKRTKTTGEDNE